MKLPFLLTTLTSTLILVCHSGCLSLGGGDPQPTSYYTLEPVGVSPLVSSESSEAPVVVGLDRIEVPSYLDRREIAVRTGDNELRFTGRNLWAERPTETLHRLLSLNIERQASIPMTVHGLPWPDHAEPEWVVHVLFESFEGRESPSSELLFEVSWTLLSTRDGAVAKQGHYVGSNLDWNRGDYASLARGLSKGLADLGRLVAKDLEALEAE